MIHTDNLYSIGKIGFEYKSLDNPLSDGEISTIEFVKENYSDEKVRKFWNIEKDYTLEKFINFGYIENNYGFRSHTDFSINNEPNEIWCFGCSCTYGEGVDVDYTWPSFIKNLTGKTVKNFGVSGAGPLTTIRLLTNWLKLSDYKPDTIYILGHFDGRLEIEISPFHYKTINSHSLNYDGLSKKQIKRLEYFLLNSDYEYEVANIRIDNIIKEHKISNFSILDPRNTEDVMLYDGTVGRDCLDPERLINYYNGNLKSFKGWNRHMPHPSPKFHKEVAEYFLNNS